MQKKRKKRIWLVILIIICAILYFVKINFLGEENYYTSEPYQFNSTSVKTERLCQFQNYTYEYQWEGWYPEQGNLITPQYRLYNTDTETGTYEVHFAFFDEAIYPFSQFEGEIIEGRQIKRGDKLKVVLGYNYLLPDKIFKRPLKTGDKIKIQDFTVEVVGFYDKIGNPQDDAQIYMTYDGFNEMYPDKEGEINYIVMRAAPDQDPAVVAERAESKLRKLRGQKEGEEDFSIQTFEQAIATFGSVIDILNNVLVLIALISVIVAGVNIMNTMYTAVLERTKEIGIMKAIGAKNSDILSIFIIESGALGLFGAGLGVIFGYLIASGGGAIAANAGYSFLKPIFPIELIIGCLAFGLFVGALAGFLPARQASKLKPVDALHYE